MQNAVKYRSDCVARGEPALLFEKFLKNAGKREKKPLTRLNSMTSVSQAELGQPWDRNRLWAAKLL
jgi:hypothetical protein